jgi:hypothetical protein
MRLPSGKALIGPAPQQKGVGFEKFLNFQLLLVCVSKVEAPTAVFEPFSTTRIFHDTIQGHKLGHNDFSHGVCLSFLLNKLLARRAGSTSPGTHRSSLSVRSLRSSESSVKLKRLFACSSNELLVLPPEAYAVIGLVKRAIFRYTYVAIKHGS